MTIAEQRILNRYSDFTAPGFTHKSDSQHKYGKPVRRPEREPMVSLHRRLMPPEPACWPRNRHPREPRPYCSGDDADPTNSSTTQPSCDRTGSHCTSQLATAETFGTDNGS